MKNNLIKKISFNELKDEKSSINMSNIKPIKVNIPRLWIIETDESYKRRLKDWKKLNKKNKIINI